MLNDKSMEKGIKNLYLILYGLYSVFTIVSYSLLSIGFLHNAVRICIMTMLIVLYIYTHDIRFTVDRIPFFLLCILIAVVTSNNNLNLAVCFLLFICADVVDFKSIVKVSLILGIITTFSVVIMCWLGIVENLSFKRYFENSSEIGLNDFAYAWGFSYYSTIPFLLLMFFLMYIYLRGNRLTWAELIICGFVGYEQTVYFACRLVFVVWVIGLVTYILCVKLKWIKVNGRLMTFASKYGFFICFIVILLLSVFYTSDSEVMTFLDDKLFSLRLAYGNKAIFEYGISPFGQKISFIGETQIVYGGMPRSAYNYVDSGYLRSIVCHGTVFFTLLMCVYTFLARKATKACDGAIVVWTICVMVFTMLNNIWIDFDYNPLLLYVPSVLLAQNRDSLISMVLYGRIAVDKNE